MAHSRQALPSAEEIAKLPPDGGPEFNRLIFESSPYLLQHARNPVDWYPWGSEAFARAKAENKPVFVSIGYSTCHWCHVMEAESFEQQDVAAILNRDYICIKVDREERPDIDQIYVTVTQMLLGRAGWPDNIWMLPDGRPFHVSTYIQKEDSPVYGPGFKTVLTQMASLYETHRAEVEADASEIDKALKEFNSKLAPPAAKLPGRELPATTLRILAGQFDQSYGGFGVAPKFPPHGHLALLSYSLLDSADEKQLQMLTTTLDAMANGGIRDHVGGGFHRYSTDAQWVLPHFEKMLYDSAQLARAYTDGYLLTGNEYYAEVARQTCDWLVSEMQSPEGGFYSAWDADSEGEEGRYYTWTRDEVLKILGNEDGELFCRVYGVQAAGNYLDEATGEKTGRNVLLLVRSWDKAASAEKLDEKALREKMQQSCEKLLAERDKRVPPELDDKVLADWNGLTLGSLAYCGRHLRESRYIESATKAASFLTGKMEQEGRLLHSWRGGKASIPGYLEDYTYLADGLLELYQSTGEQRWLEAAKKLTDELEQHFADAGGGGYFATPNDGELLLARERPYLDDVVPSGNGMAARVFVRLANLTGDQHYREQADRMLSGFSGAMQGAALSTESLQLALLMDIDHSTSAGQAGEPLLVNSNVGNPDAQPIPDAQSAVKPVSVAAYLSSLQALPGQSLRLALRISVDEGYHINAAEASGADLVPTSLLLDDNPAVSLEKIDWPTALQKAYGSQSEQLATYEGENWAIVHLTVKPDAPAGRLHLNFKLKAQPCADLACQLPVEHSLIIPFEILPADTKTKPAAHHASIFAQHGGRDTKLLSAVLRYFWAVAFIIVMYYAAKRIFGPKKGSGARPAA